MENLDFSRKFFLDPRIEDAVRLVHELLEPGMISADEKTLLIQSLRKMIKGKK